ncbi:sugar kinase [Enterococcus saccharolyticus]|uniref:2-dehydro-3-deoxygluconokinase n=1 Tax=Candidatus Enterococcus willemsii TaxID=1857215 RepID=A0ABQ6Z1P3_9ENTE|nr:MULTISPECIES: sugar kinase [Enterococcus]KAF1305399.1 2-dehydro-3-deoxygluconokinase [Enterococcus sp. CU12B]MCD5001044.1 sugar kinase [Enterococcus saccharolyticus]
MSEFLTIGEPIALFGSEEIDKSLKEAAHFQKFLAGAEVNVTVGVSRLGHSTQYITRLGKDPFGEFIVDQLHENRIGTDYIDTTADYWTAFQLKDRVSQGDPSIFYFRKGSAASHFNVKNLDNIDFSEVKLAHLSGIFPAISMEALKAFRYFVELLEQNNIQTTFDPNLRPQLWASQKEMVTTINELATHADIILPGINEGEILMGSRQPEEIADFYLNNSSKTKTVVVKLGAEGAYVKQKDGSSFTVPGFHVEEVVDTVGAGDGFAAGLITALIEGENLEAAVLRANAIGALAVQSPGDNDGYPTPEELAKFLAENGVSVS